MSKPILSVCLLTYNHIQYIEEAIDTILAQKVNFEWELIIADDFSNDGTREILLKYKKDNPHLIKLILQKSNVGPEACWLDLMDYPKSKYVLYAEGDDFFNDNSKLQRQVDYLEAHDYISFCFHPVKIVYEDKSRPNEVFPDSQLWLNKSTIGLKDLLKNNFAQTNSVMYRWRFCKSNIKEIFPKNIVPGDWFLHALHAEIGGIGFMNRVMSVYRRHPGGMWWDSSSNIDEIWKKYSIEHTRLFIELLKLFGDNPKHRQILFIHIGKILSNLIRIDTGQKTGLLEKLLKTLPEQTELFLKAQHQLLQNLERTSDQQSKKIHSMTETMNLKEAEIAEIKDQLRLIELSRVWRARNKVRKSVDRLTPKRNLKDSKKS